MSAGAGVRRFLVTGEDHALAVFHDAVGLWMNRIRSRDSAAGQTVFYTCFSEDIDVALRNAPTADVTLQEIEFAEDGTEVYPVRHMGTHGRRWVHP